MAHKITPSLHPLCRLMNRKEMVGAVAFSLALDRSEGKVAIILFIQGPNNLFTYAIMLLKVWEIMFLYTG